MNSWEYVNGRLIFSKMSNYLAEEKRRTYKNNGRVLVDKVGSDNYIRLNYKPSVGGCFDNVVVHKTVPFFEYWRDGVTYFSSDGTFRFRAVLHNGGEDYYSVYLDQIYGGMYIPNATKENNGDWAPGYNWGLESNLIYDDTGDSEMEFDSLDEMTEWVHDRDTNNVDVNNVFYENYKPLKGKYAFFESSDRTHYHYGYVCKAHACDTYNIKVACEPNINFSFSPTIIFPKVLGNNKFYCGNLLDYDPVCGDECWRTGIWDSGDDRWVNGKMLLPYTLVSMRYDKLHYKPGLEIRLKKNSLCGQEQDLTLEKWADKLGLNDRVNWDYDIIIKFHMGYLYLDKTDERTFLGVKKVPINALRKKNGAITAMYLEQGKGTSPYLDVDEGRVYCKKPVPVFLDTLGLSTYCSNNVHFPWYGPQGNYSVTYPKYVKDFIYNEKKCLALLKTKRFTFSYKENVGYVDTTAFYDKDRNYWVEGEYLNPQKTGEQLLPQPWYVCNEQYYSFLTEPSSAIKASAVTLDSIPECLFTDKEKLNKYVKIEGDNKYHEYLTCYYRGASIWWDKQINGKMTDTVTYLVYLSYYEAPWLENSLDNPKRYVEIEKPSDVEITDVSSSFNPYYYKSGITINSPQFIHIKGETYNIYKRTKNTDGEYFYALDTSKCGSDLLYFQFFEYKINKTLDAVPEGAISSNATEYIAVPTGNQDVEKYFELVNYTPPYYYRTKNNDNESTPGAAVRTYYKFYGDAYYELTQNYRSHLRSIDWKLVGRKSIKLGIDKTTGKYKKWGKPHYTIRYSRARMRYNHNNRFVSTFDEVCSYCFKTHNKDLKIIPKHRGFLSSSQINIRYHERNKWY